MTLTSDLAEWGEPAVSDADIALAESLDRLATEMENGEATSALSRSGRVVFSNEPLPRMKQCLSQLYQCAARVWACSRSEASDSAIDPFPGELEFQYVLGSGAFGQVWLADDVMLRRRVAIKTLIAPRRSERAAAALAALQNEAQLLAELRHPHVVQVLAWRRAEDDYLVMQYVEGGSLQDRLSEEETLPWHVAARYIADIGEGLTEVHRLGIVHRDIKPSNILWDRHRDEAVLSDFGVSTRLELADVSGTPLYMPPEAFRGEVSTATDVYALAATLFHLITGEPPFRGKDTAELVRKIQAGLPTPDPRCVNIPASIEDVIRSGMEANPSRRASLASFLTALRGSMNQLLVDTVIQSSAEGAGQHLSRLRLSVSRLDTDGVHRRVATTNAVIEIMTRDVKKVPQMPDRVLLYSGDRVRIEVTADQPGYLTVFNVGPTGDLNLLFPEEGRTNEAESRIEPGRPLHIVDAEMTPPAGRERIFGVWSRVPIPLDLPGLLRQSEGYGSPAYHATRNVMVIQNSYAKLPPGQWCTAVLELDHRLQR